ncbi:MAG: hypothetical protein V4726_04470 [Verrucomicrobiota bacterium]
MLSLFSRWALDDARTADERYLIFLVCDDCKGLEHTAFRWRCGHTSG